MEMIINIKGKSLYIQEISFDGMFYKIKLNKHQTNECSLGFPYLLKPTNCLVLSNVEMFSMECIYKKLIESINIVDEYLAK